MKKFLNKVKNLNMNMVIKIMLVAIFAIIFILLLINQTAIDFLSNGFLKMTKSELQVYYLDVGQANATFIILPDRTSLMIDTGSEDSESDLLEEVAWIMENNNLEKLDYLILSHSDEDHVGGAVALLEKYEVANVFRPKILSYIEEEYINEFSELYDNFTISYTSTYKDTIEAIYNEENCVVSFVEDDCIEIGSDLTINIYACEKDYYSETNAYSPYILLTYSDITFMFTGDANSTREKEFLNMLSDNNMTIDVDFLLVAHHGSKYSNTEEFLSAISPRYAIVSAGDSTHPSQTVIKRLTDCDVENIYVTKEDGTIGVAVNANGEFFIFTSSSLFDLPCIVVVLFCVCFVIIYIIDNSKNNPSFRDGRRYRIKMFQKSDKQVA